MWATTSLQEQKVLTHEWVLPTRWRVKRRHRCRRCPAGTSACTGTGRCPTTAVRKSVNSARRFALSRHRGWPEDQRGTGVLTPSYGRTGSKIFRALSCHSGDVLPQHCSSSTMQKEVVSPPLFRGTLPFCFCKAAWEVVGKWIKLNETTVHWVCAVSFLSHSNASAAQSKHTLG